VSADLSNKTAELVAAEGKITALESTGLDLKTQLGESNNARDRIQSDLDTANSRLTTLQSDKDKADAEIETLKERLISADQEFTTLQSDKDKACAEVTALKAQLASAEEASSNAKKNIERLEQIETNKDLELEELRSSEEDSKAKTLRLENDHKTTTKQLKRSEEELETKSFKLAEFDNAIRTHKKEKEDDETQIQDLRDADGRWSKLCADKVADLEEAEDEARQARGEVEAIQTHLDTAIQDHKQEKATLEEVNRALQDDNRLLQAECDRAKGEIWKERQSKRALQGRPQGYWGTVDPLSSRQDEIDRGSAVLSDKVFGVFEETKTILERTLQERRKSKAVVRSVDVGIQHPPAEDGTLQLSDTISQRDPATMSGSSGSTLYEGAEGPASTSSSPGKVKEKVDFYNRIQVPHQQNARDGEDAIQGPLSESPIVQQRAATEDLNVDPGTHLCRCSTFDLCVHGHRTWSKSGSKEQCTLCHRTYELRELDEVLFSVQCETCREKFETEWQWKEHSETS
jgi:predicted  nucleic acid-binding Zn-ribbon protein